MANCEQSISSLTSRRLLTYEKIAEPDATAAADKTADAVPESVGDFRSK